MLSQTMSQKPSMQVMMEQQLIQRLLERLELQYTLRLELIQALREERYEPDSVCSSCGKKLTLIEILKGFRDDPFDYTTECPVCTTRFQPSLARTDRFGKTMLLFYCPLQTLEVLKNHATAAPAEIQQANPSVFQSALVHFGSLAGAFQTLGIAYDFEPINGWEVKITPFLGRLTDAEIARCASVHVRKVRSLRKKLGIERFRPERIEA